MLTIGLDLHWKTSTYCILDGRGQEVKTRTLRGRPQRVLDVLKQLKRPFRITFEASAGYGWMHDELSALPNCRQVVVAHPGAVRLIFRAKRKNDRIDATKLAKLLWLGEIPPVHVPPIGVRQWRALIELRTRLVNDRTRVKNRLRGLLRTHGLAKPAAIKGWWSVEARTWMAALDFATVLTQTQRDVLLAQLESVDTQIKKVTRQLNDLGREHPGVQLLRTIPGVGPRTAECLMAYIDDPHRFARSRQIGAYFGLVPCQDASASTNRLGHITREGPGTARKLLVEAVWIGIQRDEHLRQYFDRLHNGRPDRRKIALVATAHHLLRCVLTMLKTGETWNPPTPAPGRVQAAGVAWTDEVAATKAAATPPEEVLLNV